MTSQIHPPRTVSVKTASTILDLSVWQTRNLCKQEVLSSDLVNGRRLITVASIDRFVASIEGGDPA